MWQCGILIYLRRCCFEGGRYRNPMFPVPIGSTTTAERTCARRRRPLKSYPGSVRHDDAPPTNAHEVFMALAELQPMIDHCPPATMVADDAPTLAGAKTKPRQRGN
jgi:hypothetical protein